MPIYRFLRDAAFEQADIERMVRAYEAALELLRLNDRADPLCEMIAKKIIDVAGEGERDTPRICARALKELGIPLQQKPDACDHLPA